jgi:ABC-type taurine transport system substrate-binding protein
MEQVKFKILELSSDGKVIYNSIDVKDAKVSTEGLETLSAFVAYVQTLIPEGHTIKNYARIHVVKEYFVSYGSEGDLWSVNWNKIADLSTINNFIEEVESKIPVSK